MKGFDPRQWPAEQIALAVLASILLCGLPFFVHPWYDATHGDAATYIQTARSMVAGEGYSHLGLAFHLRPPGFAALIAPVIGLFDVHFLLLNLYVGLISSVGIVFLFLYLRTYLGWPIAFLLAIACWLNPFYQRMASQVMAEAPGITFILAALLVERWSKRSPSLGREIVLAVSIVAACYVRSIAMLLVPAILLSRVLAQMLGDTEQRSWRSFLANRIALLTALVALGLLPWTLRNAAVMLDPPADQTQAWSYATGMFHIDAGDPNSLRVPASEIVTRIPENAKKIVSLLGSRLERSDPDFASVGLASLAGIGLLLAAWRRRAPAEFFVIGVLASLVAYYDFRNRLLLPVFVLMLPAAIELLRDLARRIAGTRIAEAFCCAVVVLLVIVDVSPRKHWNEIAKQHGDLFAICSVIEARLAPDARLASPFNWHYGVCLDRPVFSLWFNVKRNHGRLSSSEETIDKYGINTVVLGRTRQFDRRFLAYFENRYGRDTREGPVALIRVRD